MMGGTRWRLGFGVWSSAFQKGADVRCRIVRERVRAVWMVTHSGMGVAPVVRHATCAPNAKRRTPNAYYAIGAKNRTTAAARRLKHQIKSRLIHERRSTAKPMKSYTIQATSPETTK